MRCAIFTATPTGTLLARRIRAALPGETVIFAKAGQSQAGMAGYERLAAAVAEAFPRYDALVFVMAAGIAVRVLAPQLKSKLRDPAVLVLDERGQHVISLLSGHVGGANALARSLAMALGAEPVITTATDVEGCMAVDALGAELGLRPWPKEAIKALNAASLQGKPISFWLEPELSRADWYARELEKRGIVYQRRHLPANASGCQVVLTSRREEPRAGVLYLEPCRLIAGIGCRRDTPETLLEVALTEACRKIGRQAADISLLASTTAKETEAGLHALAKKLGCPLRFFANAEMQQTIERYALQESAFVRQTIGIGNVAEAAALCSVAAGRVALGKTKFTKVTVALVWEK